MGTPIDPTRFDPPRARWQDALQVVFFVVFARPFLALFLGLRLRGRRALPSDGPLVVVANHASHLDTLALLSLFPLGALRVVRAAAAADYFLRNVFVAGFARTFFNILPIMRHRSADDAAAPDPIAQMVAVLDQGEVLLLFPEGTRGPGPTLAGFRRGIGRVLELRPDVPVVCVGLSNTGKSLPKGTWVPLPIFVDAAIGEAFLVEGSAEEIVVDLQERVDVLRRAATTSPPGT